jgi:hypothetical protein
MQMSEQFLQNITVIAVVVIVATVLQQPLALFAILLLGHLPEIQYIDEDIEDAKGQVGEYDGDEMGFLATLKDPAKK